MLRDVSMHVTARNPLVAVREHLAADRIAKEVEIARTQAAEQGKGKPPNIVEKIAEGKMKTWYAENVLRRTAVRQGRDEDGRPAARLGRAEAGQVRPLQGGRNGRRVTAIAWTSLGWCRRAALLPPPARFFECGMVRSLPNSRRGRERTSRGRFRPRPPQTASVRPSAAAAGY